MFMKTKEGVTPKPTLPDPSFSKEGNHRAPSSDEGSGWWYFATLACSAPLRETGFLMLQKRTNDPGMSMKTKGDPQSASSRWLPVRPLGPFLSLRGRSGPHRRVRRGRACPTLVPPCGNAGTASRPPTPGRFARALGDKISYSLMTPASVESPRERSEAPGMFRHESVTEK